MSKVNLTDNRKWKIQIYLRTFNKLEFEVGYENEAHEYATYCLERGCRYIDERGVETYFPVHAIHKVKVIPPDVLTGTTTVRFVGTTVKGNFDTEPE